MGREAFGETMLNIEQYKCTHDFAPRVEIEECDPWP